MVITLPRIKIQHLPRFPIPKIKLLAGERTTTGYYEADNNVKNKRTWKPNSHVKLYSSEITGKKYRVLITPKVMEYIDKKGGFDNYILHTRDRFLDSAEASKLKVEMLGILLRQNKQMFYKQSE